MLPGPYDYHFDPEDEWFCDCAKCKTRVRVSRATYYRHAKYRPIPESHGVSMSFKEYCKLIDPPDRADSASPGVLYTHLDDYITVDSDSDEDMAPNYEGGGEFDAGVDGDLLEGQGYDRGSLEDIARQTAIAEAQELGQLARARADATAGDETRTENTIDIRKAISLGIPDSLVRTDDIKIARKFIDGIRNASLDDGSTSPELLQRLQHPPEELLDVSDPDLCLSLDLFLAVSNASRETYSTTRAAIHRRHPEHAILSYDQVKRKMAELTGILPIVHHMCLNTCVAYTGPFAELDNCPECGESRWDPIRLLSSGGKAKIPRQEFHTIPIGPQLQALWRTEEGATAMGYRSRRTQEILEEIWSSEGVIPVYEDFYHGSDYLESVARGDIAPEDMLLMLSIDGAQLYQNKASDCWIYIWVVLDHSPDMRYKKKFVLPGGFIPGPNKPKNVDSYIYPGLHHVSALQRDRLRVWNALTGNVFQSRPIFAFGTADGPGMTYLNGLVGHMGAYCCRLYCPVKGRRVTGEKHYYPALLKPDGDYNVVGCDHDDYNIHALPVSSSEEYWNNLAYVESSPNDTQYKDRRRDTGISKPSIFSGLSVTGRLPLPGCFVADLMHLISLNLTDLLLSLWRGTLDCNALDDKSTWDWAVLHGDIWQAHGKRVADATPYLPGSFDRPPRNPAEKISSGYKAWEYLLYVFALGPGIFYRVLPDKYWQHFCLLVMAVRILHQRRITCDQLLYAHKLMLEFILNFELLYYQRKESRLHFCWPSIHALLHLAPEVSRVGPGVYYTQWTMERTIGNLGEEIQQPSNPFANLSQRGVRRSQVNALKAMVPDLDAANDSLPYGAIDLGEGYILLRAKDERAQTITGVQGLVIRTCLEHILGNPAPGWNPRIIRWARLHLPNGQIARSAWKEALRAPRNLRMARNVKIAFDDGTLQYGEVQYFFRIFVRVGDVPKSLALVSLYSPPDAELLHQSNKTIWACRYQGMDSLHVIDVGSILSVVAMVPMPNYPVPDTRFVVEKLGLDVADLGGFGLEESGSE